MICKLDYLESTRKTDPLYKSLSLVEQERFQADVLYALFMSRNSFLIDRVLEQCYLLVAKKYSPDYSQSRMINDERTFVQGHLADGNIKLFNFLFMLHFEPEIQSFVYEGCDAQHVGNVWGATHAHNRIRRFLEELGRMVTITKHWPVNEKNVVEIVRKFVHTSRKLYIINL